MPVKSRDDNCGVLNVFLLKLVGLVSFEARSLNFLGTIILNVNAHCCLLIVTSMFMSNLLRKIFGEKKYEVESIAETVGLFGVHLRFLIMFSNRQRIALILTQSNKLWNQLERKELSVIRSFVEKNLTLTHFYLGANLSMLIFYVSVSQLPISHAANSSVTRSLPYAYYIDVSSTPWYELAVLMQVVSMFVLCVTCSGVDTAASFFVMIACGHLRSLCGRLQNLIRTIDGDGSLRQVVKVDVLKKMTECIVYHQMIIQFYKEVEKLTKSLYMVQLLSTTYNISLIGLKLVSDDPDKLKYLTVLSLLTCQLFMCQWAPDHLISESEFLARNVYVIPPYVDDSKRLSKLIQIVIMRSQRPLQLTAGGLVCLSIECFGSMITSAMSFFTVLRNFNQ